MTEAKPLARGDGAPLTYLDMPGLGTTPVVGWYGNMLLFLSDTIGHMSALHKKYGNVVAFQRGNTEWILAVGEELNQQLLGNPDVYWPGGLPFPVPPNSALQRLRYNLTSMSGDKHKQQRRLVMPAFHKKRIESYWSDMAAITGRMLDGWEADARAGRRRDMSLEMQQLAVRIATKTLFNLADSREAAAFTHLIETWMQLSAAITVTLLPFDRPGFAYHRFLRVSEKLEAALQELIERKRAGAAEADDVLSILVHAHDEEGGRLTDSELIGQTFILLVAGYETTARALTWTLFLLQQHPRILADLLDELAGLNGGPPAVEEMRDFPLLDRVIKESLRILPPVYITTRSNPEPFPLGRYELPGGTNVVFSHYLTHHLPELFSDPDRFLPDRWLTCEPSPYAYIPFSAGSRLCIGAPFATVELKVALPMILQRFRLTLPEGMRLDRSARATLGPKQGMPMFLARQDRRFVKTRVVGNIREMVILE
jgi:cytochrome P450